MTDDYRAFMDSLRAAPIETLGGKTIGNDPDKLPPDPDLDALPDELRERPGPFYIDGLQVTREQLGADFALRRRWLEDDESA
jgi:hypothetical protein